MLRDDSVHARIDTLDRGDLVLAKNGFGLLEKNCLRWFDQEGALLGSILSKDPIRRVCAADAMVMETRQRRAVISGAPPCGLETRNALVPLLSGYEVGNRAGLDQLVFRV